MNGIYHEILIIQLARLYIQFDLWKKYKAVRKICKGSFVDDYEYKAVF